MIRIKKKTFRRCCKIGIPVDFRFDFLRKQVCFRGKSSEKVSLEEFCNIFFFLHRYKQRCFMAGNVMDRVRKIVHADEVHRRGITGRGVTAAVMDSGVCYHPDYADRVVYFKDFVGGRGYYYDDASHGSHVTGILGGSGLMSSGKYRGIAPGSDLVHLKVLDQHGAGKLKDTIAAMEWILKNKEKFNIRVVNFSVGMALEEGQEEGRLLISWAERLWDAGLVVIVAAGNRGPGEGSITLPGTSRKVITVGFCDLPGKQGRGQWYFSGRGPTCSCVCKPEITAPGTFITSCSNLKPGGNYYCVKSGTSMATPVVSGAVCLLLSQKPWLTNLEVKIRLQKAGDDLGLPKSQQGWGRINLLKLLD